MQNAVPRYLWVSIMLHNSGANIVHGFLPYQNLMMKCSRTRNMEESNLTIGDHFSSVTGEHVLEPMTLNVIVVGDPGLAVPSFPVLTASLCEVGKHCCHSIS